MAYENKSPTACNQETSNEEMSIQQKGDFLNPNSG